MTTNALWYLGRGSGVTALLLFTLVMVLGVLVHAGRSLPGLPRFAVSSLHRTVSLAALGFLAVHVITLVADPFARLGALDTVVPFRAAYRPVWQGLGTVAFDLVLVLIATSLVRHRIGLRTWRVLHTAAYACWPLAVAHAIGTGTDRGSAWLLAVAAGCVAAVVLAVAYRLFGRYGDRAEVRAVAPPAGLAGLR